MRRLSRFGHGLIWVLLSILVSLMIGGILCRNLGISGMPTALVVAVVGITLIVWMTVAHDGPPLDQHTDAGKRDNGTGIGNEASRWTNPSMERADIPMMPRSKGEQRQMDTSLDCVICHFEMVRDDVAVGMSKGRGVCLRCYTRETSTQLPMPSLLRQALIEMLDGITTR
ncbi:MAG: hypothetical protein AB7N70_15210 [Dehalococcoidia bacterium]